MTGRRRSESGNVFFTLFGAVALVGVIGAATATLMRGPVGTMVTLNQKAKADAQMEIAGKLSLLEAASQKLSGADNSDCDADGYVEPLPPLTAGCATKPVGGGCLPAEVGSAKQDPWGTTYGYCSWDLGPMTTSGCRTGLHTGEDGQDKLVMAIISAGADRTFQTSCSDAPTYLTKVSGSDDIILEYTYAAAITASGGLWVLKSGAPDTATIDKSIEVSGTAKFQSGITGNTSFSNGSFNFAGATGFFLPDQTNSGPCAPSNAGSLRTDKSSGVLLQICDPTAPAGPHNFAGWIDVGGANAGTGVAGADQQVQFNKNGAFGASSNFTWDDTANKLTVSKFASTSDATIGGTLGVTGNTNFQGVVYTSGAVNVGGALNVTGKVTASNDVQVNGNVNINNNAEIGGNGIVDGTLNVTGLSTLIGGARVGQGSAGSPGIAFVSASTTGLFYSSGGIGLSVGGTQRAEVTSSGLDISGNETVSGTAAITGNVSGNGFHLGSLNSGIGLYSNGSGGLTLNTGALSRIEIDSGGDIGIGLVSAPTTDLDIGGVIRLRQMGAMAGANCGAINGAITYSSGDVLLVCSNVTGNWETIGTSGGGGGGAASYWVKLVDGRIYYTANNVGIGTNDPLAKLHVNGDFLTTGGYSGTASMPVSGAGTRLVFDPDSGSFRAGSVSGTQWDDGSIGLHSIALGNNVTASGNYAMGLGLGTNGGTVSGASSLGIFMGNQTGVTLSDNNVMGLFGGRMVIDPNEPSTMLTPAGSLALGVSGNVGALNFCDENGTNCFTAADIAGGVTGAPGNNREILYNSGGVLGTNSAFVFTSSLYMGLGTSTPTAKFDVTDAIRVGSSQIGCSVSTKGAIRYNSTNNNFDYCGGSVPSWTGFSSNAAAAGSTGQVQFNSAGLLGASANLFWDNANGRLGIGTSSPTQSIETNGNLQLNATALNTGGDIIIDQSGSGFTKSIFFQGFGATQFQLASSLATNEIQLNAYQGRALTFLTGPSTTATERMRITSSGQVGIGTLTPSASLDVGGTDAIYFPRGTDAQRPATPYNGMMRYSSTGNDFEVYANNAWRKLVTSTGGLTAAAGSDTYIQYNSNGSLAGSAGLVYTSAGYVGIATTSPLARLEVAGTDSILFPRGNTGNRPSSPVNGMMRYNNVNDRFEAYQGNAWQDILTNASIAGGSDRQIQFNSGNTLAGATGFVYTASGRLGLGTASPATLLDVNGTIRIAYGGESCSVATLGGIYYSSVTGNFYACGTAGNWTQISTGASGTAAGSDQQFQYNNNGVLAGATGIVYNSATGYVGIGATPPAAKLDVSGEIRVGSANTLTCVAGTKGAIRYNSSTDGFDYCGGSTPSWIAFTNASSPGTAAGLNGYVQFKSSTGNLAGDSSLFWDDANKRLAIGTSTPIVDLSIYKAISPRFIMTSAGTDTASQILMSFLTLSGSSSDTLGLASSKGWQIATRGNAWSSAALANDMGFNYWDGSTWKTVLGLDSVNAYVGIGTAQPVAKLEVTDAVRIGSSQLGCTAATTGTIRYNSTNNNFDYCGGSTPSWTSFTANAAAAGSTYQIQYNSGGLLGASSTFVFTSAGRLGVGTSSPSEILDVNGNAQLVFGGLLGTNLNYTFTYDGDTLGDYALGWYNDSWYGGAGTGALSGYGGLKFFTGQSPRLSITQAGSVGIGTTSPAAQLDVAEAVRIGSSQLGCVTATKGAIRYNSTTNAFDYCGGSTPSWTSFASNVTLGGSDTYIQYNNNGVLAGSSGLVFRSATGRVGIGTAVPATLLDVNGTLRMAYGGESCSASTLGGMYYSSVTGNFYVCGTAGSWTQISTGASGTAAGSDKQFQYNNNGVLAGATGIVYNSATGYVGIGAASPAAKLEVADALRIGSSTLGCAAGTVGAIRYNSTTNAFDYCGGSTPIWTSFAGSVTPGGSDTYIQYNSNGSLAGSAGLVYTSAGRVGIGTASPNTNLTIQNTNSSTTLANFTQALTNGGINVVSNYGAGDTYTPGIFWSTADNNPTKPKAGVWTESTNSGSILNFGVSNSYVTGITSAATLDYNGTLTLNSSNLNKFNQFITSIPGDSVLNINANNNGATAEWELSSNTYIAAKFTGSEKFRITSAGKMGIGTTSPATIFDANGTIRMAYGGESCSASTLGAMYYSSATGLFYACGTAGSWTQISTGASGTAAGSDKQFQYNNNGVLAGATGIVYNSATGYVGIGTTSPQNAVHVYAAGGSGLEISSQGVSGTSQSAITMLTSASGAGDYLPSATSKGWEIHARGDAYTTSAQRNDLGFSYWNGSYWVDPLLIDSATAYVGIYTTSPAAALDVGDAIRVGSSTLGCATGTKGAIRYNSSTNGFDYCGGSTPGWTAFSGAGATAAGSDQQVQLNNAGVLYASTGLTYNSSTGLLTSINRISVGGSGRDTNSVMITGGNTTSTGTANVFIGGSAGAGNTTGAGNIAIGYQASQTADALLGNTAIGYQALKAATTGADLSTAVGYQALAAATTGGMNTALGNAALSGNTDGYQNTAVGYAAGSIVQSGIGNTFIGKGAMQYAGTASYNAVVGQNAGDSMQSGSSNVIFGQDAASGGTNLTFDGATIIGKGAGYLNDGDGNIFIGYLAGDAVTTGTNNIVIGYNVDAPSATGSNQLAIGNLLFGTGIDGTGTSLSSGKIGIGTSSPAAKLDVAEAVKVGSSTLGCATGTKGAIRYNSTNNNFDYCGGSTPAWTSFSGSVTPGGSDKYVQYNNNGTLAGASGLVFDSSTGNVGIGTTTPQKNLHVHAADISNIQVSTAGSTVSGQSIVDMLTKVSGGSDSIGSATSKGWQIYARGNAYTGVANEANDLGFAYWNGTTWGQVLHMDSAAYRVGILTDTPAAALDVADAVRIGSSTLGCASGTTGAIRYNSTNNNFDYCGGSGPAWTSFSTVTAAGSTGYVQFKSSTGSLGGDSGLFWDDTNKRLGIGTVAPGYSLHIHDSSAARLQVTNSTTGTTQTDGTVYGLFPATADTFIWNFEAGAFFIATSNLERMRILSNGNMGVGTVSPAAKLDVADAVRVGSSQLGCATGTVGAIRYNSATNAFDYCGGTTPSWTSFAGNVTPGGSDTYVQYNNNGVLAGSSGLVFRSATGRVGLGTASPATLLDVNGTIRMAYGGESCSASTLGGMYYSSATGLFYVCGTAGSWTQVATGTTGAAGSDKQFQYNNNGALAGATGIVYNSSTGYVGIGAASPAAKLEVADALRIGSSTLGCATGTKGAIRYNSTNNNFDYCGGSGPAWTSFAVGATPAGSDQQVQYNNNGVLAASSGMTFNSTTGALNISGAYQIGGANGLSYPSADTTAGATIAIGSGALGSLPATGTSYGNTAVGYQTAASISMTSASNNLTAVGYRALNAVTGQENTAVGSSAGLLITSGIRNTVVGYMALSANTIASYNTAVGRSALQSATGSSNSALGYAAGQNISSGTGNTAIGYNAALGTSGAKITGTNNTAVGYQAGLLLQGATATNALFGASAGAAITTGSSNVVIGPSVASTTLATGSNNILIGTGSGVDTASTSTSNYLNIGGVITGDLTAGDLSVSASWKIGSSQLGCITTTKGAIRYNSTNNNFDYCGGSGPAWTSFASSVTPGGSDQQVQLNNNGVLYASTGLTFSSSTGVLSTALLRTGAGTVAAPSYSFTADTDTGLYNIGANSIGIATNGVLRLTIQDPSTTDAVAVFGGTSAITLPGGLDATRPSSGVNGMVRYNTTSNDFDIYANGAWKKIVMGASSAATAGVAGSDKQIQYNNGGSLAGASGLVYNSATFRFGINTASPATILDVNGTLRMAYSGESCSASTLGAMYYSSATGLFYACGTAGSWTQVATGSSNPAAGSTGYVQFRSSTGNLGGDSGLFWDDSNKYLGVGTTSPQASLHVSGGNLLLNNNWGINLRNSSGTDVGTAFKLTSGDNLEIRNLTTTGSVQISAVNDTGIIQFLTGSSTTEKMRIANNGNVGIGTASPAAKLDVADAIRVGSSTLGCATGTKGAIRYNSTNNNFDYCGGSGPAWTSFTGSVTAAGSTGYVQFKSSTGSLGGDSGLFWDDTNKRLGIGTAAPGTTLEIAGATRVTGGGDIGIVNGSTPASMFLQGASDGSKYSILYLTNNNFTRSWNFEHRADVTNAFQLTYYNGTTYTRQIFIDPTGSSVSVGASAGANLTATALQNALTGYSAGSSISTGDYNTAIGGGSLATLSTNNGSTAVGYNALNVATGGGNIAIGYQAGDAISTGTNNIVIGYDVDAPSATTSNQLVIGNLLFGTGLDGTGTSLSSGKIGIGTSSPAAKLDVADAVRVGSSTLGCATGTKGAIRYNSTNNSFDYCGGSTPSWTSFSGSVTPAGSDQQVQLNSNGVLYASTGLTFSSSTGVLTVANRAVIGGSGKNSNSVFVTGGNLTATGADNVVIGSNAGNALTTSNANVVIGKDALKTQSTAGGANVAIGYQALQLNTSANNVAVGYLALGSNSIQQNNTAIGYQAATATTGGNAVAVGYLALSASGASDGSVALGAGALSSATGTGNIGIGNDAGNNITSGAKNIVIGYDIDAPSATTSNQLNIGNVLFGTGFNGTNAATVNTAGKVGIVTNSPAAALDVADAIRVGSSTLGCATGTKGAIRYNSTNNNFDYCGGSGPAWTSFTGSVTAAGSTGYVQFKSSTGSLGGDSGLFWDDTNKFLGIGTTSPGSLINTAKTFTAGSTGWGEGVLFTATGNGASASYLGVVGTRSYATINSTGTTHEAFGVYGSGYAGNDATAQQATAFLADFRLYAGDTGYGISIQDDNASTGGTGYGVYINLDDTNITRYGIYQVTANNNYFAGNIGIGTASPAAPLDVSGAIRVGSSTLGCATGTKGSIRYNSTGNNFDYCGGAGPTWTAFGTPPAETIPINDLSDAKTDYTTDHNMWLGSGAGAAIASGGQYNVALGENAGAAVSTGDNNIFIGESAGAAVNTGTGNVGIGRWALKTATSGSNNTAIGYLALQTATGGSNTSVGSDSSRTLTTGVSNTALGNGALYTNSTSNDNTAIGFNALQLATGANNIGLGSKAGDAITTGGNNIVIGYDVDAPSATTSNQLNVGNVMFGTGFNVTNGTTVNTSGRVGIAKNNPAVTLDVVGDIQYTGTITDVSDRRLKKDIHPLAERGSMLEKLGGLGTYSFRMKNTGPDDANQVEFGVMAQEIEKVFPELVRHDDSPEHYMSVNYVGLIAPMIEAGKELEAQNKAMKAEIAGLKAQQAEMKTAMADIQASVNGLKAHTGYGIGKAGIDSWVLLLLAGIAAGNIAVISLMFRRKKQP